ncbi:MAG: hypothetical protein CMN31_17435 [Sandaracinus sp.]|nr:hypothetical protein [Sandaracinus sp.]
MPARTGPGEQSSGRKALALVGLLALGWLALVGLNAWVADDAYITFRTVDHALRGEGLTWNPGERVQAYTHPLWMLLLLVGTALLGSPWAAALTFSFAGAIASLGVLVRTLRRPGPLLVVFGALLGSKTALHYATSGLETPLLVLLALLLVGALDAIEAAATPRALRRFAILAGLLLLTRMDTLFALTPMGLWGLARARPLGARRVLRAIAPGLLLVLGWVAFSLVYYGFPVPNTAYAKLGHGIPAGELATQGGYYVASAAFWDPVTPLVALAGGLFGLISLRRRPVAALLGAGALVHVAYVVSVGGDFMNGRFLLLPFWWGALALARAVPVFERVPVAGAVAAALFALGAFVPERAPWDVLTLERPLAEVTHGSRTGVGDEQRYYLDATGLWDGGPPPEHVHVRVGRSLERGEVHEHFAVGFLGWAAEDRAYLVDAVALGDAYLARFPSVRDTGWRIGHTKRRIPEGYAETLRTGECHMSDPDRCAMWEHVRRIVRGPIFDGARWESLWLLHTGGLDRHVDEDWWRRPELVEVAAPVDVPVAFGDSGVAVALGEPGPARVRATLEGGVAYEALFRREGEVRCRVPIEEGADPIEVELACDEPVDEVLLQPTTRWAERDRHQLRALHPASH